jgi:uncharacterized protein (DUF433 family)
MEAVAYPHIDVADGMPVIAGTRIRVIDIVVDQMAHGWDAPQIQRQHPQLTLAQIYSALAYYHDHQPELDAVIEQRLRREEQVIARLEQSPLQVKLRTLKRQQ